MASQFLGKSPSSHSQSFIISDYFRGQNDVTVAPIQRSAACRCLKMTFQYLCLHELLILAWVSIFVRFYQYLHFPNKHQWSTVYKSKHHGNFVLMLVIQCRQGHSRFELTSEVVKLACSCSYRLLRRSDSSSLSRVMLSMSVCTCTSSFFNTSTSSTPGLWSWRRARDRQV